MVNRHTIATADNKVFKRVHMQL